VIQLTRILRGHGTFSNYYGLGIEQVLDFEVVVPGTGEILTGNANENPDLFWALKRGGGATFRLVTRIT
jgi:FAD/FMN-containing dehydrogenase